ncbi:MAG: beta-carotene 15,15'-dioxygenase, Brp/Blh family [Bacteroidota bacterium]
MSMQNHHTKVDYLFAGAGASATLLLMCMEKQGLLKDKKILILDPDTKQNNDKTYCFWSEQNEQLTLECQHLISHQWDEVCFNRNEQESLLPKKYFHVAGIDVYKELRRLIDQHHLERIQSSVVELAPIENGVKVITDTDIWESSLVFDSRPPKYLPLKKDDAHLLQSFIGYVIKTDEPNSNLNCVDLMDFNVDQLGTTQFMYILPLGEGKTLVELTRFGLEPITQNEAKPILDVYITHRFGNHQILHTEIGCIPMSTAAIAVENLPGVIPIGGRAGAVKPSTGYAFKNMFHHAEQLADSLKRNIKPAVITESSRFRYYDRLLLLILSRAPSQGKSIFEALFKKNETKNVLQFLDEKTSLLQDIRIFLTLPIKPFLKAVGWVAWSRIQKLITPFFLLLLSLLLLLIYKTTPQIFNWIQIAMFTVGMFLVGIPHGAVDHLLETGNLKSRIKYIFVINYLGLAFLNLILWIFFPIGALLFFIGYSAWHFGQTDLREWKPKNTNALKNTAWGILILSIILCGHVTETNTILENMNALKIPIQNNLGKQISVLLSLVAIVWAIFEKRWMMFLSSLMLLVSIELPLITSFGLYFIGQHSMNGWSHLKQGMKVNNTSLYLKALPFTIGALVLFAAFIFLLRNNYLSAFNENLITIFFVFISCISFPHVMAMNKFYKTNTKK